MVRSACFCLKFAGRNRGRYDLLDSFNPSCDHEENLFFPFTRAFLLAARPEEFFVEKLSRRIVSMKRRQKGFFESIHIKRRAFSEGILRDDCYASVMLCNPSGRAALVDALCKYQRLQLG